MRSWLLVSIGCTLLMADGHHEPVLLMEDSKPTEIRVDDDAKKLYLLHAPEKAKAPRQGWRALIVMPGGDGSADFAGFVGRIREHALGEEWIVAQLVAPVWDEKQSERNVWPTKKMPYPGMRFTTEEHFAAVLEDLRGRMRLDPRHLFTLAWSSSGTAAYTLALAPDTPVTGTFVAMSVFRPDDLPPLEAAKGRSFYLLHSPEDFIPIAMAREAREQLEEHGAAVTLREYEGGHGWHGDAFGELRRGVAWLDEHATGRPARPARRPR